MSVWVEFPLNNRTAWVEDWEDPGWWAVYSYTGGGPGQWWKATDYAFMGWFWEADGQWHYPIDWRRERRRRCSCGRRRQ